jgi:hypothetical protein
MLGLGVIIGTICRDIWTFPLKNDPCPFLTSNKTRLIILPTSVADPDPHGHMNMHVLAGSGSALKTNSRIRIRKTLLPPSVSKTFIPTVYVCATADIGVKRCVALTAHD